MHPTTNRSPRRVAVALRTLAVLSLAALLAWASPAFGQEARVVDALGREVVLEAPALRVVSMVPSHTETLCALGACDRLVGRDALSDAPAAALAAPSFGTAFTPDLEAIVAAAPDLVLADAFTGLPEALAPFGIAVYAGTPQRLDDLAPYLADLGALLGLAPAAEALGAELAQGFADVRAAVAGAERPTVFVEIDATPYAAGPTSLVGALVELAGGAHILDASLGDYPQVDPEFVVAADPMVVLLLDAPYGVTAASVAARPGWGALRAVVDGRVVELTQAEVDALSRPGPRLAEAAWSLARRLHPERF
ncbi:MAG: helical backbone metal receptor [Trueperaceae bacterium]|nr:helical backbone metal receptor [Trueperaceae bacterium]